MFEVVVFLACRRATPEGPRGPGATLRLPYTLEGVTYTFQIDDPAAEPPFGLDEIWLYLRFFRRRGTAFVRREFGLRVLAVNDDGSRTLVPYPAGSASRAPYSLGNVPFPAKQPVVSWPFPIRNLVFPSRGQYEFRLLVRRRKPSWRGAWWSYVGSHFIALE
ncbi:MAG: hypothetical protein L0241_26800 [Planctomycetia bacterium]|nr:hypothetical protein [Planctomycetia bacterium]